MSSIREILTNFQSGQYNNVNELEEALEKIYSYVIFDNDTIDDMETYDRMKDTLDDVLGRRFCTYCEIYYNKDSAIQHENTNVHRTNIVNQLGSGFLEIESAIGSRLKTFWITNDETAIDIVTFLEKLKNQVVDKINEQVLENNAIKFNLVLITKFKKGENEELDVSFKTENKRVLPADRTNLVFRGNLFENIARTI